jgi:hypothetical protein
MRDVERIKMLPARQTGGRMDRESIAMELPHPGRTRSRQLGIFQADHVVVLSPDTHRRSPCSFPKEVL